MKPTHQSRRPVTINIGLFGGTFDPIHTGHLIIAEGVREHCGLDRIYFIPAKQHALKDNTRLTAAKHRLAMVRLAIAGNPCFKASDVEIQRTGVSYSIDTVKAFRQQFPDAALSFLVGSDIIEEFHLWKEPGALVEQCTFIAFGRPGFAFPADFEYADHFRFVEVPAVEISATEIRRRVKSSESIRYLVPEEVREYISRHKLYGH